MDRCRGTRAMFVQFVISPLQPGATGSVALFTPRFLLLRFWTPVPNPTLINKSTYKWHSLPSVLLFDHCLKFGVVGDWR